MNSTRKFNVTVNGELFVVSVEETGGTPTVREVRSQPPSEPESKASSPAPVSPSDAPKDTVDGIPLTAPMPGTIINYEKQVGDKVREGDTVVILEAMKMENALPAPASGVIKTINFKSGDSVARGDILCIIEKN
jgi:biotin carboxyl carrier protein